MEGNSLQIGRNQEYKPDPNKFDMITHHWNGQGHLIRQNHYVMYVREGTKYFERPVNSGNLWHENNTPAGRVTKKFGPTGTVITKSFDHTALHIEYNAPLEGDEALKYQLEQERSRSADLEKELAAIRAEQSPKEEKKSVSKPAVAALAEAIAEPPKLR